MKHDPSKICAHQFRAEIMSNWTIFVEKWTRYANYPVLGKVGPHNVQTIVLLIHQWTFYPQEKLKFPVAHFLDHGTEQQQWTGDQWGSGWVSQHDSLQKGKAAIFSRHALCVWENACEKLLISLPHREQYQNGPALLRLEDDIFRQHIYTPNILTHISTHTAANTHSFVIDLFRDELETFCIQRNQKLLKLVLHCRTDIP